MPLPGREHFVAHAARELFNSSVDIKLREVYTTSTRASNKSPQSRLNEMVNAWEEHGMPVANPPSSANTIPSRTSIPMPFDLYRLIDQHIRDHRDYRDSNRQRLIKIIKSIASSLVTESDVDEEAKNMVRLSRRIMKMVHVSRNGERSEVDFTWRTLTDDFQRIESHLLAMIQPATTLMRNDLDAVLEETNA